MKKVKFKKYIPKSYENGRLIQGTGRLEDDYTQEGLFHQWGVSYEEFESGPANFTIAIIELPDGSIVEIEPNRIKFL